jgi:hypothetical protein
MQGKAIDNCDYNLLGISCLEALHIKVSGALTDAARNTAMENFIAVGRPIGQASMLTKNILRISLYISSIYQNRGI